MATVDTSTIQLQLPAGQAPTLRGIVAQVSGAIQEEIEAGDLPKGGVGIVVAIMHDVLEAVGEGNAKRSGSPAGIEGLIKRVVARVFDASHPVRVRIDDILWALKTAAAMDKAAFGGLGMQFARDASVDAVLAAMQKVQATANAATRKLSAAALSSEFGKEMAALNLHGHVLDEAKQLVKAGLVTEVIGMLRDDTGLSKDVVNQLKCAGARLAVQATTAAVARCTTGKCNWAALLCCRGGT